MPSAIAAIVYAERAKPDEFLARLAGDLAAAGVVLAGVVQRDEPVAGRRRCDMHLDILGTGASIAISEYRGEDAKGCRVDVAGLSQACAAVSARLAAARPALMIINKFGKIEVEGGGLRDVIAEALAQGIALLIGVPSRNLEAWRGFAGDYGTEFAPGDEALAGWLAAHGFAVPASAWQAAIAPAEMARQGC